MPKEKSKLEVILMRQIKDSKSVAPKELINAIKESTIEEIEKAIVIPELPRVMKYILENKIGKNKKESK